MTVSALFGQRVLVVEDEMMIAMMIEDLLMDCGCTIVGPAVRVADAMKLLENHQVDAALLDVNLNGEETYPIALELQRRDVPFVFATGYGSAGVKDGYGQYGTVQKPFQAEDLYNALISALSQKG